MYNLYKINNKQNRWEQEGKKGDLRWGGGGGLNLDGIFNMNGEKE